MRGVSLEFRIKNSTMFGWLMEQQPKARKRTHKAKEKELMWYDPGRPIIR